MAYIFIILSTVESGLPVIKHLIIMFVLIIQNYPI